MYVKYGNMDRNIGLRQIRTVLFGILFTLVVLAPFSVPLAESKSTYHGISSAGLGNSGTSQRNTGTANSANVLTGNNFNNTNTKVIMINFDDAWKSQIQYAKPILDKYGFKASFFIVCNYVNSGDPTRLNWQDITTLQHDQMDIESHTMDHKPLDKMSTNGLIYEIGGSKQCLASHGINSTIFAYPFNLGSKIPSVVDMVSHYYDFARTGTSPLMFLNCIGYPKDTQTDCRTYLNNGQLTLANRYDIRSDSFFHISSSNNFSPSEMFQKFIQQVNSQIPYNNNDKINAIPIITYHQLASNMLYYNSGPYPITVQLFDQEMRYLHDNGFRVVLLNQLGFDPINNIFYLKNMKNG